MLCIGRPLNTTLSRYYDLLTTKLGRRTLDLVARMQSEQHGKKSDSGSYALSTEAVDKAVNLLSPRTEMWLSSPGFWSLLKVWAASNPLKSNINYSCEEERLTRCSCWGWYVTRCRQAGV
jgi:hypothetical protein